MNGPAVWRGPRRCWLVGELVAGLLLGTAVAGLIGPAAQVVGFVPGRASLALCVAGSVVVGVVAGEWLRKGLQQGGG